MKQFSSTKKLKNAVLNFFQADFFTNNNSFCYTILQFFNNIKNLKKKYHFYFNINKNFQPEIKFRYENFIFKMLNESNTKSKFFSFYNNNYYFNN